MWKLGKITTSVIALGVVLGGALHARAMEKDQMEAYFTHKDFYLPNRQEVVDVVKYGFGFNEDRAVVDAEVDVNLMSDYALLVNLTTNEVIYEKNAHERTYPASLTKMMTVLVGLEHRADVDIVIDVDFETLANEGAAIAGFSNGQHVSYDDLLYGVMLPSGADAAQMLAKIVAGSEEGFVELMNEKAQRLGMKDTHFTNVVGLHDDNHYSTPWDLAILEKVALSNDEFREIFSAPSYQASVVDGDGNPLIFTSRMFDRMENPKFEGGQVLGGKTGYTYEAALCLASYATDGENEYALVTTHANGNSYTPQYHVLDALTAYDYFLNDEVPGEVLIEDLQSSAQYLRVVK